MKTITIQTVFEAEDEYSRCSDSELIDAISRILNAYFYHDTWISVGETEIVDRDTAEIEELQMSDGSVSDEELVDAINKLFRMVYELRKEVDKKEFKQMSLKK